MPDQHRLLVDPNLLRLVESCACECGFKPVPHASIYQNFIDGTIYHQHNNGEPPAAVLFDGRNSSDNTKKLLQHLTHHGSQVPVLVVLDSLADDNNATLLSQVCHVASLAEIDSGRLTLILKNIAAEVAGRLPLSNHLPVTDHLLLTDESTSRVQKQTSKTETAVSLTQIAIEMMNRVQLSSLLQHIAYKTGQLSNADYSFVAMVHETGDHLETVAVSNDSRNLKSVRHKRGEGIGGQTWQTAKTVCVKNYQNYSHRLPGLTNVQQACGVPLILGDEVIGVLGILYETNSINIETQVEILETFAPLAAVAIENATLHENTKTELDRTCAINNISRAFNGPASFDNIIDQICTTLIDAFDSTKVHIYRLEENNSFTPLAAWEKLNSGTVPTIQSRGAIVAKSIASWCIENQKTGFIRRGVNDERESAEVHRIRAEWRLGSTLVVPLVYEDKSWGVLFAHRSIDRSDYSEREQNLLELACAQISVALLRRELLEKIEHQAYHDSLTGLTNRYRFDSLLTDMVKNVSSTDEWFAILFIDLDGFKDVNDSFGHDVGDYLLQQVAVIISQHLSSSDVLARIGGDEFAMIISTRNKRTDAICIAEKINESLTTTIPVKDTQVEISASIGISYYPDDAKTASHLLKHADFAMYHAKETGQHGISVFNQSYLESHEKRKDLEHDLSRAIDCSEFELHYQPKVCCHSGIVTGVEALIRWQHPTRGFIPPSEFIPAAERSGQIETIGGWVLDEACRQCAEFIRQGLQLSVAVNISARQFSVASFVETVFQIIGKHEIPAELLELEVTESVVMKDIGIVVRKLAQLRSRGIKIAIDDFGTGYSSLQYLAELPLDVLKIDKTFIDRLGDAGEEQLLVKSIVTLSSELHLKTVAEGVETELQRQQLAALGCDCIQGYLYSRPVPASKLREIVNAINQQALYINAA